MLGKLLVAHPLLNDGFFNRSVVYISQYLDESVVGFVLNFKTQFKLRDLRPQVQNGNWPIYDGGPVAKNQLFFLHNLGEKITNAIPIQDNLFFGGDFNDLLYCIDHEDVSESDIRFFVGYSGWSKDQLDNEIERGSWYVNDIDASTLLSIGSSVLWGSELAKQKNGLEIFSEIGWDPSNN